MSKLTIEEKKKLIGEQFMEVFKLAKESGKIFHEDLPQDDRDENLKRIPRHLLGYGSGFFKTRDLILYTSSREKQRNFLISTKKEILDSELSRDFLILLMKILVIYLKTK